MCVHAGGQGSQKNNPSRYAITSGFEPPDVGDRKQNPILNHALSVPEPSLQPLNFTF